MAHSAAQIGARLRAARDRARLSQTEVGEKLNVNYVTISRWERGKQRIRAENLVALSELYGEDLTSLAGGHANGAGDVKRATSTPRRLAEPRPPAYAGISFDSPIAAQRSRLWLEGFLLELAESGADVDFLERLEAGVRAILRAQPEKRESRGVKQGGGTPVPRATPGDR